MDEALELITDAMTHGKTFVFVQPNPKRGENAERYAVYSAETTFAGLAALRGQHFAGTRRPVLVGEVTASKGENPGFSGFLPTWGFRVAWRPGFVAVSPHCTARHGRFYKGKFSDFSPLEIANFHIKMVSWYVLCPLSGVVVGQVRSTMLRR